MKSLTHEHFAQVFGCEEEEGAIAFGDLVSSSNFNFVEVKDKDRDDLLKRIHARIESGKFARVGEQRRGNWQDAWSETLERFITKNYDLRALNPDFMDGDRIFRLHGRFIRSSAADFEINFYGVVRAWIAHKYVAPFDTMLEFGCGSGFNLSAYAKRFLNKTFVGLDWSEASVKIANLIGEKHKLRVQGEKFDFFEPTGKILPPSSSVVTMAALEQVGDRFEPFISYLLQQEPGVVVHMEPIEEFYDAANPVDEAALCYHRHRGYLNGFLPYLQTLEKDGRIKILEARRLGFGSLYHEAYSLIVWKPLA